MIYGITDISTFILGTIFIILVPGPNSIYVMTVASRWGIATGYRGVCGIFLGDMILMTLAATGVASLLQAHTLLFLCIKYAGAGYLLFLGLRLLWAGVKHWRGQEGAQVEEQQTPEASRTFRVALIVSIMNPKAIFFYVSFFIQFVEPGYAHPEYSFMILGSIVQFCSMAYLSILIFAGAYLARLFRNSRRMTAAATGGVGSLFIGFGAKLASANLG